MTRYAVALGSNLGDRIGHLRAGLDRLAETTHLVSVSPLYETAPVGGPEQGPFLNAVAVIETTLDGHTLLGALNEIEASRGRDRLMTWGPRTLDLDLIATDGKPVDDPPRLIVPHPRAVDRRFVVEPLSTVWPEADLGNGVTATEAFRALVGQDSVLVARHWRSADDRGAGWVSGQILLLLLIGLAIVWQGSLPQGGVGIRHWAGAGVAVAGVIGLAWAAASLGANLTALPEPVDDGSLTSSGPYRWVRHPMYTSVIMTFAGAAMFFAAPLAVALVVVLFGYLALKARHEERRLRIAYPSYRDYQAAVRHRFIPGLF